MYCDTPTRTPIKTEDTAIPGLPGRQATGTVVTAGADVKQHNHAGKICQLLKQLNTPQPGDPAIPFLGIYPREVKAHAQRCVHGCSQQLHLQQPRAGNNPNVHRQVNG